MSVRIAGICTFCAALLLFAVVAQAQTEEDQAQTEETQTAKLEQRLNALEERIEGLEQRLTTTIQNAIKEALEQLGAAADSASPPAGLESSAEPAESDFAALWEYVYDHDQKLGYIVKQIVDEDGRDMIVLNVRGQMDSSPTFRQDMSDAVHASLHRQGVLVIENRMGTGQYLLVNRKREYIPAGTTRIPVPVGTVTTELEGYESPKNWTIGAPNYEQKIVIAPSPVRREYLAGPVYVEPAPLWYVVW
jgi:Ni,Fe-hydrogenase III component G